MIGAITAGLFGTGVPPVTNSYESIATVTVGSGGSATVSFTSIPSTYKHLQIRSISRCSRTSYTVATIFARFNSDTGNNYAAHVLYGTGASVSAYSGTSQSFAYVGLASGQNATASGFAGGVMDILDYANTNKNKTVRTLSGFDNNGSGGEMDLQSGLWQSTSAINRIDLTLETSANFLEYSTFALYGIKG